MRAHRRNNNASPRPLHVLTGRIRTVLVALTAALFAAFYLIGYDMPFAADPQFTAPLFTDAVIWFIYVLVVLAVMVTAVSVVCEIRVRRHSALMSGGVPAGRIAWGTAALLAVAVTLTFAFGSTEPLEVNGRMFTSHLWLRLADMFINTSVVLTFVATVAVAFGMSGLNRRMNRRLTTGHGKRNAHIVDGGDITAGGQTKA